MKKIILTLSFILLAQTAFAQKAYDRIVYSLNSQAITAYQLKQKMKVMAITHNLSLTNADGIAKAKRLALDQILKGLLLEEYAMSLGADINDQHVEERLKQFMKKKGMNSTLLEVWLAQNNSSLDALKSHLAGELLQQEIINEFVKKQLSLTETSLAKMHADLGDSEYEIKARHILFLLPEDSPDFMELKSLQYAMSIRQQILNKKISFTAAAKKYSGDPSAQQNAGDLGTFKQGMMLTTFTDASLSLKLNQISFPVRSSYGYHLIQVTGRKKVAKVSLIADKTRFQQLAYQTLYDQKLNSLIKSLKKDAQINQH